MIKSSARAVRDFFRYRFYSPYHAWAFLRRRKPSSSPLYHEEPEVHLRAAMNWLLCAYRATGGRGVAARYALDKGWTSAYPETSGYIVPTLFRYGDRTMEDRFEETAYRVVDWLLEIQMESGAFPGGHLDQNRGPVVFNTGQILIGLTEAYRRSNDDRYGSAARRAGEWLVKIQDDDGAWRKHTYKDRFHAYHTRVAWPLAELGVLIGEQSFIDAGCANLDFALTLQEENGWFRHNTLDEETVPFTHTLAYVTRGLLEAGILLDNERYVESASNLASTLWEDFNQRGYLAGQYNESFGAIADFSCLTGCAQLSIIWQMLDLHGAGRYDLREGAIRLNRQVMHCQDLHSHHPGIRGAVPGSWPIEGPYIQWGYPNWAAKFLADALMLELDNA